MLSIVFFSDLLLMCISNDFSVLRSIDYCNFLPGYDVSMFILVKLDCSCLKLFKILSRCFCMLRKYLGFEISYFPDIFMSICTAAYGLVFSCLSSDILLDQVRFSAVLVFRRPRYWVVIVIGYEIFSWNKRGIQLN